MNVTFSLPQCLNKLPRQIKQIEPFTWRPMKIIAGLTACRKTKSRDREDFKRALEYQQRFYMSEIPFLDLEMTDGIITLLVEHLNKFKLPSDIAQLVPCLSEQVVEDVMTIVRDIFEDEYM